MWMGVKLINIMKGIGSILKSCKEINERKAEIKRRERNKKTPKQIRDGLLAFLESKNKKMTKERILEILHEEANKPKQKINDFVHGQSCGKMEAYSHAWNLVKKLNIDDVSKRCEHCDSNNVTVGDGGLWCDNCGGLTKKK